MLPLIAANGSGRSTALRHIDRLEITDSREIPVCGRKVQDPALELRKLRLDDGIVFQSSNLFPHRKMRENVLQ